MCSVNDSYYPSSSGIMTLNEAGLLEHRNSTPQVPLIKNKAKELFGLIRSRSKPAQAHLREALTASWVGESCTFCAGRLPHPALICSISPPAPGLFSSHQSTPSVFEDRVYWVREQKMLNYRYKWTGRNTPFWSHCRLWLVTLQPHYHPSSAFSHVKVLFTSHVNTF